jgi:sugar phosphate permease
MSFGSRHRSGIVGFVLLYVAFLISYVDRSAISLALGQIGKDFDLQAADLGIISSAFFLGYAVMQIPGGWLADRFGSKYVIVVAIAMWSVFTVMTSFAWSLASLIAVRLVFGLTEGAFPAASFKGLAELFDRPERPKLAALLTSSNYAGSMVAPLIMAPLIIAMGWRYAFEAIGFAGIAFAVVYIFLVPHVRPAAGSGVEPASIGAHAPTGKAEARELLKDPLLWQLLTVWFGVSCVNKGLDSWMPIYLLQQRGLDLKAVGILTPIPFLLATIATAIGGWVMTRFFPEREKFLLIVSAALTGIFLFAMYESRTIGALIFFQSLVYFFKSFVLATVVALPNKILPGDQIGTGLGMINFGGQCAGFVAPMAMGFLVTGTGSFDAAFDFLLAMTILAVVMATMIRNREVLVERMA